ncbi:MAG TPA: hypothetical protein VHC22_34335 [Pirellulales bacterium]|nr:hypothetical protein [Pirellulales bacterium]
MTSIDKQTKRPKRTTYVRRLDNGLTLEASVSPCVFMYHAYPLQIGVRLCRDSGECLGEAHAADCTKDASTYTDADVERLLAAVRISPCPKCSAPAFDPATVETNRGGLCERCFLAAIEAEWADEDKAMKQAIASRDRRMKARGMAVRVTGWVHSDADGDDYMVNWYLPAAPTANQVRALLRKEGSAVTDDYQVVEL